MASNSRREKGTGSWDTIIKGGISYYRFRKNTTV